MSLGRLGSAGGVHVATYLDFQMLKTSPVLRFEQKIEELAALGL